MNPKLIQAQIEAQAFAEAYRGSIVECQAQKVKAEAQAAVYEAARSHMDELRRQSEECHTQLAKLHEEAQNMQRLAAIH